MAALIIDGKAIAAKVRDEVRERICLLKARGINPCLAVILVGEDPASLSYVRAKQRALAATGMEGRDFRLSGTATEGELLSLIDRLNAAEKVHGILVQLPLPAHIREEPVINALDPRKDVDGIHPLSLGKLLQGKPDLIPCTPLGIVVLLKEYKIPIPGSNVVIVGRSTIVGKPLAMLLARREHNATVTLCNSVTLDLPSHTRRADILIAAAGRPGLIKGNMIKEGAAVIDVGINRTPDSSKKGYSLRGDVEFDEAQEIAGWITPVPGGVGPMTIAMLMQNLAQAAEAAF